MAGRGTGPDFVEALARGLDVLACFDAAPRRCRCRRWPPPPGWPGRPPAGCCSPWRSSGYVRSDGGGFALTPRVLDLGMAYVGSLGLWDIARPHLEELVAQTGESSSMAQLDGSDIVYVARVSVPKLIALRVEIGTRFPAAQTSQGKVLLAALPPTARRRARRAQPGGPAGARRPPPRAAGRGADRGAGAGLGAGRRGARAGRAVGRGAGAGRRRARSGRR